MKVEVWVDILCPWCLIGERRLRTAISASADPSQVEVVWRSYELGPDSPRTPGATAAEEMHGAGWWGDAAEERINLIRRLGAAEGVELNLDVARPVNSFDALRLVHLAADRGRGDKVLNGLLVGYHTEGRNIADPEVLRDIGLGAGLLRSDLQSLLATDLYAEAVRSDERRAVSLGVTGVPTMVVAGEEPLSAVSSVEELRAVLDRALAREAQPANGS